MGAKQDIGNVWGPIINVGAQHAAPLPISLCCAPRSFLRSYIISCAPTLFLRPQIIPAYIIPARLHYSCAPRSLLRPYIIPGGIRNDWPGWVLVGAQHAVPLPISLCCVPTRSPAVSVSEVPPSASQFSRFRAGPCCAPAPDRCRTRGRTKTAGGRGRV